MIMEAEIKLKKKSIISDLKCKQRLFFESREHANTLVEILELVQSEDAAVTSAAIKASLTIFTRLFDEGALTADWPTAKSEPDEEAPKKPEDQYKAWLHGRYRDCLRCLAWVIETFTDACPVQELALRSMMRLLQAESYHPLCKKDLERYVFPSNVVPLILLKLLSRNVSMEELIGRFQEYLDYDDVRFSILLQMKQYIRQALETDAKNDLTSFCNNAFALLTKVTMPTAEENINNFFCRPPAKDKDVKFTSLKEQGKAFSDAWLGFLGLRLPTAVYKKTLVLLHDTVMPHMINPLLLADFLTVSYNIGGAVSLLALNGLFILINQHNLEYPEFYKKLYALLEPSVFHAKYRARFFHLVDLFLSSTYLPAYLVAAFAKRLSRLALTAPPTALMLVIPFVCNLLIRHGSCQVMVNRKDGPTELPDDPYVMEETDPAKCRAMESSLWEIRSLKSHYHPGVATAAAYIDRPLPRKEWETDDYLELSGAEMIGWATKKKMKTVAMAFERPKGLFDREDKTFTKYWSLD